MTADSFSRAFALAFGAHDADALAALLARDAGVLTLTGIWAEGRDAAKRALMAEFSGTFARARLVTGKAVLLPIKDGAAVLHQRFVVSGAVEADGTELPRFAAMLSAVLVEGTPGAGDLRQAASLTFSALTE